MTGEELIPSFFLTKGDEAAAAALTFRAPRTYAMLEPLQPRISGGWLWLSGRQQCAILIRLRPVGCLLMFVIFLPS
jgi:hypothetical protein